MQALGAPHKPALRRPFAEVNAAYQQPHRAYHTWEHIASAFAHLDEYRENRRREPPTDRENRLEEAETNDLTVALFYHDAVYEPSASDNEERSAELCSKHLEAVGVANERRGRIARLIMATKHLGKVDAYGDGVDHVGAVLQDIDLSILGTPPPRYRRYVAQIRKEHRYISDTAFRDGRRRVVTHFLAKKRLYRTEYFFARFEIQARQNLALERSGAAPKWF